MENSIYDDPIYDESDGEAANNGDEEGIACADTDESLVIRRILNANFVDVDEAWLRHNIFHDKYTSGGKVYSVIVDSGSYENVVSTTMVEKLGLKTEDTSYLGSRREWGFPLERNTMIRYGQLRVFRWI